MHLSEFKAWFEGFTEGIGDKPTEKQWKRIKARVAEIDGTYTPPQVFIDRYWFPYRPLQTYPWSYPTTIYNTTSAVPSTYPGKITACSSTNWIDAGRAEASAT